MSVGRILREEARLAFYDPRDLFDKKTGEMLPIRDLPERIARAIVNFKVIQTQSLRDPDLIRTEYRYKFADKGKALGRLSKHLGLYERDNTQKTAPENSTELLVSFPSNRDLTIAEWTEQVEEINRIEAEKEVATQTVKTPISRSG